MYKIDPPVSYLPTLEEPKVGKDQMVEWKADLRSEDSLRVKKATEAIAALNLNKAYLDAKTQDQKDKMVSIENVKFRLEFTECKGLYHLGDYKTCLEKVLARTSEIEQAYPDLRDIGAASAEKAKKQEKGMNKEDYEFNVEDMDVKAITKVVAEERVNYMYLKYKLLQARLQKAIGMNHVASELCM